MFMPEASEESMMTPQLVHRVAQPSDRHALRATVADSLGGEFLDEEQVLSAYEAALVWLHGARPAGSSHASNLDLTVVDGSCDGGLAILHMAVATVLERTRRSAPPPSSLVWIGCRPHTSRSVERGIVKLLRQGATVIASDRSADAPFLCSLLLPQGPRAPRLARLRLGAGADQIARVPFLPAVRLPAGHLLLTSDVERVPGCRVLSRDGASGDPLAVLIPVLSGNVLYTSAHWYQDEPVDMTQSGRRSLFAVPGYARAGRLYPWVTVGEFHAALGMLSILIAGLEMAWSGESGPEGVAAEVNPPGCEREETSDGSLA
jgi:hypothetical protein